MEGTRPLVLGLVALFAAGVAPATAQPSPAPTPAPTAAATPASAPSAVPVAVRTGDHRGFGRVVIDLVSGVRHTIATHEGGATLRFDSPRGAVALSAATRAPRNVKSLRARDNTLELELVPGAKLRSYKLGDRLVLDVSDAEAPPAATPRPAAKPRPAASPRPVPASRPTATARPTAKPAPRPNVVQAPLPSPAPTPAPSVAERPDTPRTPSTPLAPAPSAPSSAAPTVASPVVPSVAAAAIQGLAATRAVAGEPGGRGDAAAAITLPFGPAVGAAALRRGDVALVVFDDRRPVDLAGLRGDAVFRDATITVLPTATLLRLPLLANQQIRLARAKGGWTVSVLPAGPTAPALRPIRAEMDEGRMRLPAEAPGQVVSVPDPLTGGSLMIGTQKAVGQGVPIDRRTPEFALLPTWQGVAVMALTDALTLRPNTEGFILAADAERALALSASDSQAQAMTEAAASSRRYDLPALPVEALQRRLQSATLAAATAQPQARTARRREVAEALLALGMGAEMHAVMAVTVAEDARAAEDPDIIGLASIAALLAGRTKESAGIDDPRLTGTDEIAFWRAVRAAQTDDGGARPAAIFGSAMNLLLSYPAPLRDRLAPLALETMALGGEAANAAAVLEKHGDQPGLELARGYIAEKLGDDPAAALSLYDKVASGSDRRARARAARRAIEMRLASGAMTSAQGADALERLVFAWRGDQLEIDTRLRIAELRAGAGAWRMALAALREARAMFPDEDATIRQRLADTFARSLATDAQAALSPLDLVALAEENADLLPAGGAGHELAASLADRLVALDLPQRAAIVLEKLVAEAPPGVARAVLGGKLAALRMQEGNPEAALATLAASVVQGAMPPDVLESRTLTFARASAARGNLPTALAVLAELGTPATHEMRATLLEEAKDWPAASAALAAYARTALPATGMLDPAQSRLLLRLASAASQASDQQMLAFLRESHLARLPEEELRNLFDLITAAPVNVVADLPRAAQETQLARGMPESFKALAHRPPP